MFFLSKLKLRGKLLVMVLPLVLVPILIVGMVVGYIANQQAYLGITKTSKDDLDHMTSFSLDLLQGHYQQYQVYKQDKLATVRNNLATLVNLAYDLVASLEQQHAASGLTLQEAKARANRSLKDVRVGETGYIYAMTTAGDLVVHKAAEGTNIMDARDERGRYFIREMCRQAPAAQPGEILYITYPWRNPVLGDEHERQKIVAYRYFPEWDWIIGVGSYLDETYEDLAFENEAFAELKEQIKAKRVGDAGYIYVMDIKGNLKIHPFREGDNIYDTRDEDGRYFIREMCTKKQGWIRYPWRNEGEKSARMKIVRYSYFEPWGWIVAVGSYEDEFYGPANLIKHKIFWSVGLLVLLVGLGASFFGYFAAKVFTAPIYEMISVMRQIKKGRMDKRVRVQGNDELAELAETFNAMSEKLKENKEIESNLAQQGRIASLGVLSSSVAHEINNPLGVIQGYVGYLEGKIDELDPNHKIVREIKQENRRCMKIVNNLLSYTRTPLPDPRQTDLNELLGQIVGLIAGHQELRNVAVERDFAPDLPYVMVDADQIRQVVINLLMNAGKATGETGRVKLSTALVAGDQVRIVCEDSGPGINEADLPQVFEPFFTTKPRGTGLGLAISRQIIEAHHGSITIESRVGKGTKVIITLPHSYREF
ncbi:MAG: cache domain-containing protein [Proteobacteria bacterium]|nr:cache domain-containing protein [Pseudomonadota bacterium]MBU0968358.1 cache domain-containing protein [Pseudomonadota bacterium]